MKTLQHPVTFNGLKLAISAFALFSACACSVKTSGPSDMMPDLNFPKSSLPEMPTVGASKPTGACPPGLADDYNKSMDLCLNDPTSSDCADSQNSFTQKYSAADCTFRASDGSPTHIQIQGQNILITEGDASALGNDTSASAKATPTPTPTPLPRVSSGPQACSSEVAEDASDYLGVCLRIMNSESEASDSDLSSCADGISSFSYYDSYGCTIPLEGSTYLLSSSRFQDERSTVTAELQKRQAAAAQSQVHDDPAPSTDSDDAASDDDSGLSMCSAKETARFAVYLKNTSICRASSAKLASHRKACIAQAQALLKVLPQTDCQVSKNGANGLQVGTELNSDDVRDQLSSFQRKK